MPATHDKAEAVAAFKRLRSENPDRQPLVWDGDAGEHREMMEDER